MEPGFDAQDDQPKRRRAWEWTGLQELVATCILLVVLLGAALGMVLRMMNPKKKAVALGQAVGTAVHKVARDAQEAAVEALAPAPDAEDDDVKVSV